MKKLVVILLCSIGLLHAGLGQNTKYKFFMILTMNFWILLPQRM